MHVSELIDLVERDYYSRLGRDADAGRPDKEARREALKEALLQRLDYLAMPAVLAASPDLLTEEPPEVFWPNSTAANIIRNVVARSAMDRVGLRRAGR